jgi:hypothetical protein
MLVFLSVAAGLVPPATLPRIGASACSAVRAVEQGFVVVVPPPEGGGDDELLPLPPPQAASRSATAVAIANARVRFMNVSLWGQALARPCKKKTPWGSIGIEPPGSSVTAIRVEMPVVQRRSTLTYLWSRS